MAKHAGSFDLILDTVSADHDLNAYLALLKLDATMVLVGAPPNPQPVGVFSLIMPRRTWPARSSAASRRRRRCSTSAASTTSRAISSSSDHAADQRGVRAHAEERS
jgi:hypothetical protein